MQLGSEFKILSILVITIIAITFIALTSVSASGGEGGHENIITNEIIQYLKNKKVRASDEKLKKIAMSV